MGSLGRSGLPDLAPNSVDDPRGGHIFVHVDESGPFDEKFTGVPSSVVGGVCSFFSADQWECIHREHLADWNATKGAAFSFPVHYHCGPLLSRKLPVHPRTSVGDIRDFADSVFRNSLSHALFGFASKNRGKRFEYSPQATYVMNLTAALRCAFECLGGLKGSAIQSVTVVVAQRTIGETTKASAGNRYMSSLLSYVADQLLLGDGPGVVLARRLTAAHTLELASGIGDRDAGLMAADFVCCLFRQGSKSPSGTSLHVCQPDQNRLLGDYRRFHERLVVEFLQSRYYGSCLDFLCRFFPLSSGVPDTALLLKHLDMEQDPAVLEREVPALLMVIHQLAKTRTEAPNLLACAISVAERLASLAERRAAETPTNATKRLWLNLEIQGLAELAACHNHTGAVGPQKDAESKLTALLMKHAGGTGFDSAERRALIQDVRNRNLNLLFNDFRFEDAYSLAEELVAARQVLVGKEDTDELLGRMLGSQGQACAFMARLDPTWSTHAVELFQQSLKHFSSGSRQEQMSQSFLVTALWQAGDLQEAARQLPPIDGWSLRVDNLVSSLCDRLRLPHPEQRAFDVVNCLRIIAGLVQTGEYSGDLAGTAISLEHLAQQTGTDHPYEHWWKWLGVLHLFGDDALAADRCFSQALAICRSQSFTMKTIATSVVLLRVVTAFMQGSRLTVQTHVSDYTVSLRDLRNQSTGFDCYMTAFSAKEVLEGMVLTARPRSAAFWTLCTHLPFAYS